MTARKSLTARGFSLVELLIVIAVTVIALAVAVPGIVAAYRNGQLQTAVDQARMVITRRAVEATQGERRHIDAAEVPLPGRIQLNPNDIGPPPGTLTSERVEFQGERGTALVDNRPQRAAWVFRHEAEPDFAYAVVVGSSALVEDWVYEDRQWRKR